MIHLWIHLREAILQHLIGSFSHYLHLFTGKLYIPGGAALGSLPSVESKLSHYLPALIDGIPIGIAMICQFVDERSWFQAGFCWGVPLGFQCLILLVLSQGTLGEANAVAEKTRGLSSGVMCWGVKNSLRKFGDRCWTWSFSEINIQLQRWDPSIRWDEIGDNIECWNFTNQT